MRCFRQPRAPALLLLVVVGGCCSTCSGVGKDLLCAWSENTNYIEGDLGHPLHNVSREQCCKFCTKIRNCSAAVHDVRSNSCFLKEVSMRQPQIRLVNQPGSAACVPKGSWEKWPGGTCALQQDADFAVDSYSELKSVQSSQECGNMCLFSLSCTHFVWIGSLQAGPHAYKRCYLKSGRPSNLTKSQGLVAGICHSTPSPSRSAGEVVCTLEMHTDFHTGYIADMHSISSAHACADACAAVSQCTHFAWVSKAQRCFLKGGAATNRKTAPGVMAGICRSHMELKPLSWWPLGNDGIVGQTPITGQASASESACTVEKNVDYYNGYVRKLTDLPKARACADACAMHENCTHFAWLHREKHCYLKDGNLTNKRDTIGIDTGVCRGKSLRDLHALRRDPTRRLLLASQVPLVPSVSLCVMEMDTDHMDGHMMNLSGVPTAHDCAEACTSLPNCTHFAWVGNPLAGEAWYKRCYLKSGAPRGRRAAQGLFAGICRGTASLPVSFGLQPPRLLLQQASEETTLSEKRHSSCELEEQTDYDDGSLAVLPEVQTSDDCAKACLSMSRCTHFTWIGAASVGAPWYQQCFLKNGAPRRKQACWGRYSGVCRNNATPATWTTGTSPAATALATPARMSHVMCQVEPHVDYNDSFIVDLPAVPHFLDCADACTSISKCTHFSWIGTEIEGKEWHQRCFLKGGTPQNKQTSWGMFSGICETSVGKELPTTMTTNFGELPRSAGLAGQDLKLASSTTLVTGSNTKLTDITTRTNSTHSTSSGMQRKTLGAKIFTPTTTTSTPRAVPTEFPRKHMNLPPAQHMKLPPAQTNTSARSGSRHRSSAKAWAQCKFEVDVDYKDAFIAELPPLPTVEGCAGACMANSNCTHFVWVHTGEMLHKRCFLMGGVPKTRQAAEGLIAGICRDGSNKSSEIGSSSSSWPSRSDRATEDNGTKNSSTSSPALLSKDNAEETIVGCKIAYDTDYKDDSLEVLPDVPNVTACAHACANTSQCTHFSWIGDRNVGDNWYKHCFIKSGNPSNARVAQMQQTVSGLCRNFTSDVATTIPSSTFRWKSRKPITCKVEADVDYDGVVMEKIAAAAVQDCADRCATTWNCTHFSWLNESTSRRKAQTCHLMGGPSTRRHAFPGNLAGICYSEVQQLAGGPAPETPACIQDEDTNYIGGFMAELWSVPTAQACADACRSFTECTHFAWRGHAESGKHHNQMCYVKRGSPGQQTDANGTVSGVCRKTEQELGATCADLENGVEYEGDHFGILEDVTSPMECCQLCTQVPNCSIWTFLSGLIENTTGSKCIFRNNTSVKRRNNHRATSGRTTNRAVVARPRNKRGLAWFNSMSVSDLGAFQGISWIYTWSLMPDKDLVTALGQTGIQFVPMNWGAPTEALQSAWKSTDALLVLNEPNFRSEANLTPEKAAQMWPQFEAIALANGLRLSSPTVAACGSMPSSCEPASGAWISPVAWLENFFTECQQCSVDFIATHIYTCSMDEFRGYLDALWKKFEKPIWLTEWACPQGQNEGAAETNMAFLHEALPYLDNTDYIERYAWFGTRLDPSDGYLGAGVGLLDPLHAGLSKLGRFYDSGGRELNSTQGSGAAQIMMLTDATGVQKVHSEVQNLVLGIGTTRTGWLTGILLMTCAFMFIVFSYRQCGKRRCSPVHTRGLPLQSCRSITCRAAPHYDALLSSHETLVTGGPEMPVVF